VANELD